MGAGASTAAAAYTVSEKASLMHELGESYETIKATGEVSDIELYAKMTQKFTVLSDSSAATVKTVEESKVAEPVAEPEADSAAKQTAAGEKASETVAPSPKKIVRMDSVADEPVIVVDDADDDDSVDSDHHNIRNAPQMSSTELLSDLVNEQQVQDEQISQFLGALKEGNVQTSKSSGFRTRRLTYAQKTVQDPEVLPEKMSRKRTTMFSSSEIGVTQEKRPPFDNSVLGTFSCHGIEPGEEPDPEFADDDDSYIPPNDKINQDRGCVVYPFKKKEDEALFLVLDGHGEQGDKISEFVMRQLFMSLEKQENLEDNPHEALKDTFVRTNMALMVTPINYMSSGTTCVAVYVRGKKLFVANCGDSRAVMAKNEPGGRTGGLHAVDLSRDHKPDDPEEQKRIEDWGGFVRPAPEPGLSARVYLDAEYTMIGLAMARSLGDYAVKAVGVIPEPEVTEFVLEEADQFMIMASDGVWEFISSQEAVDIVQDKFKAGANCTQACQELIEQASQRWIEEEGDYRDDITAIVVKLPLFFQAPGWEPTAGGVAAASMDAPHEIKMSSNKRVPSMQ